MSSSSSFRILGAGWNEKVAGFTEKVIIWNQNVFGHIQRRKEKLYRRAKSHYKFSHKIL